MWDELCDVLLDLDFLQMRMGVLTEEQEMAAAECGEGDAGGDEAPFRERRRSLQG